jgi:glycosyltransferase involved in cell wall biosynthesis
LLRRGDETGITGELVRFERAGAGKEAASGRAVEALAEAMLRYARDPELRARHGRAARDRIERDFDARVHARRIQDEIVKAARCS